MIHRLFIDSIFIIAYVKEGEKICSKRNRRAKVIFIDSLPLTPVGKVDFKRLEEMAAETE